MSKQAILSRMRWVGLAEGASFVILLGIAMPLKYLASTPLAVRIAGPIHGVLFLMYVACIVIAVRREAWPKGKALTLIVASLLPFGPLLVDSRVRAAQRAVTE